MTSRAINTANRRRRHSDIVVLRDGTIDVGDYDLVVPVPQVDGALAATCPLVLSGYAEGDIIGPFS